MGLLFVPEEARDVFATAIDEELLDLLSLLNRARVATWCWIRARFPDMRWHGEHHVGILRDRWDAGPSRMDAER